MISYKAIIWDADGVLISSKHLFSEQLSRRYGIESKKMLPFFLGAFRQCTIGKADLKQELAKVIDEWDWNGTVEDLLHFWLTAGTEFDPDMLALVKDIHNRGVPSYIASGQEKYRGEYIRNKLAGEYVDRVFISCEIGNTKMESSFWDTTYQAIVSDPRFVAPIPRDAILYIDDGKDEVAAAREFGYTAYTYDGNLEALKRYLLP